MENGFEKYCLERLEALEKENAELKDKIKSLEENSQVNRSNFLYYKVMTYTWNIDEKNYARFEQAVADWDYQWLSNKYFSIQSCLADYEITIGGITSYFMVESRPEGKMIVKPLDLTEEGFFDSYSAAKEYLIKTISDKIKKIKKELADKAKEQAE